MGKRKAGGPQQLPDLSEEPKKWTLCGWLRRVPSNHATLGTVRWYSWKVGTPLHSFWAACASSTRNCKGRTTEE